MRRLKTLLALFAMVAAASATVMAAPAGGANSTWSVVPSPNRDGAVPNTLNGVSCVSATFCAAAGYYSNGINYTLIESWNGAAWKVVPSPSPGTADNRLLGVSCVSASSCVAVGFYSSGGNYYTLIESWNGAAWKVVPSPNPAAVNSLYGVSCVSFSSCTAVGYYNNQSGEHTLIEALVRVPGGTAWKVVPSPSPSTLVNQLFGVSCLSTSFCVAAGITSDNRNDQTLIESWDGSAWSVVSSPNGGATGVSSLNGVSCVSASICTAVGFYQVPSGNFVSTLVESWNGSAWSVVPSPNQGVYFNYLTGVSCLSAISCMAVGYRSQGLSVIDTLVESWDGSTWSIVPSPSPGSQDNQLPGVSCLAPSSCTAVGLTTTFAQQTLVESWDGTAWSIVLSPNATGTVSNTLAGMSCLSSVACTAVGYYVNGFNQTLIEHLIKSPNGTVWSVVPSPNAGTQTDNYLKGVSCASASFCTAVGYYFGTGGVLQTLIESWDGSAWSVVPSPSPGTGNDHLYGVSCVSASFCTAVGDANGTLIESWDGSTWSVVPSPSPGTSNQLNGVSCVSASSCMAVGFYYNGSGQQTLIESWNGTAWSVMPSPSPGTSNELAGVSCVSASSCMAVGSYNSGSVDLTLIETWHGTSWSVLPSPNPGMPSFLRGVSCVSASSCSAVGLYGNGGFQTLIEAWDGTSWSVVPSPSPGAISNELNGASCVSTTSCTAVGSYLNNDGIDHTLIEESA